VCPGARGLNYAPGAAARTVSEIALPIALRMFVRRVASIRMAARLCIAAVLLAAIAGTASAAEYKIGFVNTERLFREATPAKRAQAKIEKEFATRDAEIQKLAKQVRDLQAALDRDGATMADTDRRNKERDLANQTRDLQRMQREFREDINLRKNEEISALQERANKVIQQIAESEKYDLILQDPVVYASQRIDITDKVIKALADK
jgi:outer membrane protein